MNTQLIYVSKEKASVFNEDDGTFINEISNGIKVKKGDAISVESICINNRGIGSDIVEIPKSIKNYPYFTNKMVMEVMFYLNNNRKYCCMLPSDKYNTAIQTTISQSNYGYSIVNSDTIHLPITEIRSKSADVNAFGKRYYLGAFCSINDDPTNPTGSQTYNDPNQSPQYYYFNFIKSKIEMEVDTGYDNPDNIAQKITRDFHTGDIFPNQSVLNDYFGANRDSDNYNKYQPESFSKLNRIIGGANSYDLDQLVVATKNGAVYTIDGLIKPYSIDTSTGLGNDPPFWTLYSGLLGVRNPYYYYWGSRLQASSQEENSGLINKNMSYIQLQASNNNFRMGGHNGDIYMLYDAPTITEIDEVSAWNDGYVMTSNLKYNPHNIELLSKFFHSQKQLINPNNNSYTRQQIEEQKSTLFRTYVDIGRYNDSATALYTGGDPSTLQSCLMLTTNPSVVGRLKTKTFFNQDLYNKRYSNFPNDEFIDNDTIYIDNLDALGIAKKYDINIVPVNTTTFGNNEICIGVILEATTWDIGYSGYANPELIKGGNYFITNFTFYNQNAQAVAVSNPTTITAVNTPHSLSDYEKIMMVGSPNLAMEFDGVRGRFNLNNMYWANYIGHSLNESTAIATAGTEVITANSFNSSEDFGLVNYAEPDVPFLEVSQSGLGIADIYLIKDDNSLVKITNDNYKTLYKNSLLDRLGFSYKQLTDDYGLPDVLFTSRHYQTDIALPYPNFFPYPLTCNPLIDTSKDIGLCLNEHSLPMFNLSMERRRTNVNLDAETDKVYARDLPQKLFFPYWLIKSDIIDGVQFNTENQGQPQSIVAVCNRAYISGDNAYSFASDVNFVADKDFVLTSIKTQILNPDLSPAEIEDRTAIIYKVVSPLVNGLPQQK